MRILNTIYTFLRKYLSNLQLLAIGTLAVFVFLFSESNLFAHWRYDSEIRELNRQIKHYKEQTEIDQQKLEELEADKDQIEKFARENYLMKKTDEDIFIVE